MQGDCRYLHSSLLAHGCMKSDLPNRDLLLLAISGLAGVNGPSRHAVSRSDLRGRLVDGRDRKPAARSGPRLWNPLES